MMTANGAADNDDDEDDRRTDDNAVPQLDAAIKVAATVRHAPLVRPRFRFVCSVRAQDVIQSVSERVIRSNDPSVSPAILLLLLLPIVLFV